MKKKIISVFVGMVMAAVILTGCDDTKEEANDVVESEQVSELENVQAESNQSENIQQNNNEDGSKFTFSTTDIDGNSVSIDDFSDAKLIMVNFWEPWCGPCVGEMPDLEKLYEEYKAEGFVILGIYSSSDMEDEAREVLDSCGTTYPVLNYVSSMEPFTTEYVPTTVFLDGTGNVLTDEPIVGGQSYDDWKEMIEEYLHR